MSDKNLTVLFVIFIEKWVIRTWPYYLRMIRVDGFVRKKFVTTLTGIGIFPILFSIYIWTIRQDLMVHPYTLLMQYIFLKKEREKKFVSLL